MQPTGNFLPLGQQHAVLISDAPQNDDENHIYKNRRNQRTKADDRIRVCQIPQQRGGKGLKNYNLTAKTGLVAGVAIVEDGEDVMLVENGGVLIRMPVDSINIYKRDTQGVILMRVDEGSRVISIERVDREEEEPETPVEE